MFFKISYKLKFIFIYLIVVATLVSILFSVFSILNKNDVTSVSSEYFKVKFLERSEFIRNFFSPYETTLKAILDDTDFKQYIDENSEKQNIENHFLTLKKSLPCATQIRFIDINGFEKIRVDGDPIGLFKEKANSYITQTHSLQNKKDRNYFKQFITLEKGEVGLSTIDLNIENGKVVEPKQPTLRIAMAVYKQNQKVGIVVINICMRTFFQLIDNPTLYHVYLIDEQGRFLNHHDIKYGIVSHNFDTYTLEDEFGAQHSKNILTKDEYTTKRFYSNTIKNFNNKQNLKMVLDLKFSNITKNNQDDVLSLLLWLSVIALFLLPIIYYFAKIPDLLYTRMKKQSLTNKPTNLPNRIALIEDLEKNIFKNDIIILLHIDNLIKLQNLYGYEISDKVLSEIALYLSKYKNKSIKKLYIASHATFAFKYAISNDTHLKDFTNELLKNIENNFFYLENDIDVLVDVTIGVSDPNTLHNNINELKEAELALDNGIENHNNITIYNPSFLNKMKKNKSNIDMAKKIKKAIEENTIEMHYQPIYNNFTEKIEKYEALIRLRCDNELIYPDNFLPISKELKKYHILTYIVIDKTFQFFKDKEYEFSINLSALDIFNENFIDYFIERVNFYDVSTKLVVEIVESESIENYEKFYEFVKVVKKLGCKIAVDDFGSGYSNFEHILNLSDYIDYIKIDGSLIKDIEHNNKLQILVGSLKFLCDNLGIKTIAEYVENKEILRYLNSMGIDYSQGYYIGKPSNKLIETQEKPKNE